MTTRIGLLDADAVTHVCERMRAMDRAEIFATQPDDDVRAIAAATMALTRFGGVVWKDNEPVAVACAMPLWPGVWSAGMYATDLWPQVAHATTRWIVSRLMPDLIAAGAHRAECRSLATHVTAHRWLERLGATREAVLADCGRNRETFYLYAWTLTHMKSTNIGER